MAPVSIEPVRTGELLPEGDEVVLTAEREGLPETGVTASMLPLLEDEVYPVLELLLVPVLPPVPLLP